MSGQKLGHQLKYLEIIIYTLEATFGTRFWLRQNVWFDNILAKIKYGSCQVKNYVTRSNLRKFLCTFQRPDLQPTFDETS